jgi:hypothetical protein
LRFVENRLREAYGFDGVPLTVEVRESHGEVRRRGRDAEEREETGDDE